MRFILTYYDIRLWMHNYLDLDMQLEAYDADSGEFTIISPTIGVRKLLPESHKQYRQLFHIEGNDSACITINISGPYERDEVFCNTFAKYVNYCLQDVVIENISHGRIKIHLDRIELTSEIKLQSIVCGENGIEIEFADNPNLYEHLRMIQMLLQSGYTNVHVIPSDMPYQGFWFADDTMNYTLITANHPADMRLCASVHVMEWIGLQDKINKYSFQALYPSTQINYQYRDVKVKTPLLIAEPEINSKTIVRNCNRIKEEVTNVIKTMIDLLGDEYNSYRKL